MGKHRLVPHPDTPCRALDAIEVTVAYDGVMRLDYRMIGRVEEIVVPALAASERTGGLWRTTCFEAFVAEGEGYLEFNLAPSTQWASYRFDAYREGMRDADIVPLIDARADGISAAIEVRAGRLGLSAVIKERSGAKSYWALAHPPEKPDFHHPDCFALQLAAARRA